MVISLIAACTLAACSDNAMSCGDTTTTTFTDLKTNVLKISCVFSSCHNASSHQSNLDLQTDPYTALVNVKPDNAAAAAMGWKRVVPNDLNNSFMYYKLTHASDPMCNNTTCMPPACCLGNQMPNTGQVLDQCSIDKVKGWILRGAPND